MRTLGIWTTGLIACALIGGVLGSLLMATPDSFYPIIGFVAGAMAFACLRLWFAPSR